MRFLAVQTDPVWHDVAENRRRIEGAIDASGFAAGDYVVLPEMCETAWTTDVDALARAGDSVGWFAAVARARRIWLQAGFAERRADGRWSNSAVVIGPDGVVRGTYRKNFLFPSEQASFEAGAEVFAVSSSWPSARHEHWRALLVARAVENQACVIAANRCGSDPTNAYAGGSVAIDVRGVRIAEAGDACSAVTLDVDRAAIDEWRTRFGALRDIRPSLLGSIDVRVV
jgi:predicted amidohydrolase